MTKIEKENYILHATAIHNFLQYVLFYEKKYLRKNQWDNDKIILSPQNSAYFGFTNFQLGGGKTTNPQLLIQNEEKKWFAIMQWEGAFIIPKENLLLLKTKTLAGDDGLFPLIESIGIGIKLLNDKIFQCFTEDKKLIIREAVKYTNNQISIITTEKIAQIPIKIVEKIPNINQKVVKSNKGSLAYWVNENYL